MSDAPIGSDPRHDPTFAPEGGSSSRRKVLSSVPPSNEIDGPRRRIGARSIALAIALAAVWGEVLFDATVRTLVLGMGVAIGCTLGLMAAAMALGLVGFGLFALFDRASVWLTRVTHWPDE
jgi:hypothetical protein